MCVLVCYGVCRFHRDSELEVVEVVDVRVKTGKVCSDSWIGRVTEVLDAFPQDLQSFQMHVRGLNIVMKK